MSFFRLEFYEPPDDKKELAIFDKLPLFHITPQSFYNLKFDGKIIGDKTLLIRDLLLESFI